MGCVYWVLQSGDGLAVEVNQSSKDCGTSLSVSLTLAGMGVGLDHLPAQPQARSASKNRLQQVLRSGQLREAAA